jgi:predicted RNase H-like HicB family nuclease
MRLALTSYIEAAMETTTYEKLEDGTYGGEIPGLEGVIAFGPTLRQCQQELRSTLEDWILVGFHLGHTLPVIAGIDLNKAAHAPLDSLQAA